MTNATSVSESEAANRSMLAISATQGRHHVAHRLRKITRPLKDSRVSSSPIQGLELPREVGLTEDLELLRSRRFRHRDALRTQLPRYRDRSQRTQRAGRSAWI